MVRMRNVRAWGVCVPVGLGCGRSLGWGSGSCWTFVNVGTGIDGSDRRRAVRQRNAQGNGRHGHGMCVPQAQLDAGPSCTQAVVE